MTTPPPAVEAAAVETVRVPDGWPPYTFRDLRAYVTSVQRHERLTNLRRVLEGVDPATFDMTSWWCATSGCAAGHCAHDAYFNRLHVGVLPMVDTHVSRAFGVPDRITFALVFRGRIARGYVETIDGMARVFRLDRTESEYLFAARDNESDHSPASAALRVDTLLTQYPVLPNPLVLAPAQQAGR